MKPPDDPVETLRIANTQRKRLEQHQSIEAASQLLRSSSNILVLTGAGISTSVGIPDFRSNEGLYSNISVPAGYDAEDAFHIETFWHDPTIFFDTIKSILPSEPPRTSPTHAFIHLLQLKGKLLRNYTQNIDNLEEIASISRDKVVQVHGSFATATCMTCGEVELAKNYLPIVRAKGIPRCKSCEAGVCRKGKRSRPRKKRSKKRKRSWSDDDDEGDDSTNEGVAAGVLKPDITFFGEPLQDHFSTTFALDRDKADLLVVIGTSLAVAPVSSVLTTLPEEVPQIYVSRTACRSPFSPDVELLGDCDIVVEALARTAGWTLLHEMIPPDGSDFKVARIDGASHQLSVFLVSNP